MAQSRTSEYVRLLDLGPNPMRAKQATIKYKWCICKGRFGANGGTTTDDGVADDGAIVVEYDGLTIIKRCDVVVIVADLVEKLATCSLVIEALTTTSSTAVTGLATTAAKNSLTTGHATAESKPIKHDPAATTHAVVVATKVADEDEDKRSGTRRSPNWL